MITVVRSVEMSQGKQKEAVAWAVKMANYLSENFIKTQTMRNIGGKSNQLHLVSSYESLAAREKILKKIEKDAGIQALVAELEGLFVESSTIDSMFETIS